MRVRAKDLVGQLAQLELLVAAQAEAAERLEGELADCRPRAARSDREGGVCQSSKRRASPGPAPEAAGTGSHATRPGWPRQAGAPGQLALSKPEVSSVSAFWAPSRSSASRIRGVL